ncbi:MAG: Na/Pi symporter [Chloroflexota bacterium]|nr:Na/Pi symporter [Chloroflexota bacterium]MDE2960875.1 Na/Pi symporter [Chloroflexota bacterium]
MIAVLGGILGGVGLLFFGMWLLSENLKTVVGPRLRVLASRLADNRFAAFGWGTLAGAITQSSPAVTFITISMLRSGLISAKQGYPIALGAQMGVGLILFIVTVDIRVAALYGIGVGGVIITRMNRGNYREAGAMLFGVAALLFGLVLIKESAQPLADQAWFQAGLEISAESILLSFILGALLTFIVQALVPVVAFGIGLAAAQLVGVEQVLMYIYGSYVGLAISVIVVSSGLSGTARQLGMFWAFQVFFSAIILVILLYVEVYAQVPLVKALVTWPDIGLGPQMALAVIVFGMPSRIVVLSAPDWTMRLFARIWPASAEEERSRPQFIHDQAIDDVATALDLAHLEQKRVLGRFSEYLEQARMGQPLGAVRQSTLEVNGRIEEFLTELGQRNPGQDSERRNTVLSRQKLITWLEEQFSTLPDLLRDLPEDDTLEMFQISVVEGTDAALLIFLDALEEDDPDSWAFVEQVMGDRRSLMQDVRARYLAMAPEEDDGRHRIIVEATNAVENIFFLLAQLTRDFQGERRETATVAG